MEPFLPNAAHTVILTKRIDNPLLRNLDESPEVGARTFQVRGDAKSAKFV